MSDATENPVPSEAPVRSTTSVLLLLGGLVAVPVLILLVLLLLQGGSSGAGGHVADAVNGDRVQAVYMANDRVFFGSIEELDGDWFELQDAFYLRRGTADSEEKAATTDLVPIQQEVGGDGDMVVNTREVVLIQDLAKDSEIAREIEAADS